MRNLYFLSVITFLITTGGCATTKSYGHDEANKTYAGQLSDSTFNVLKQYLVKATNANLKDTIIIKYDYNHENCWTILDENNKDYIMGFVTTHQDRMKKMIATRPNASIFDFREPGNDLNKIKKWDNSIVIDSSKQLFNLLFKERCTCGSSIIVMPDRRFVFLRSDSHSEALDLTQQQIEVILNKK